MTYRASTVAVTSEISGGRAQQKTRRRRAIVDARRKLVAIVVRTASAVTAGVFRSGPARPPSGPARQPWADQLTATTIRAGPAAAG